eukprot:4522488-Amphidinium_carterae.3
MTCKTKGREHAHDMRNYMTTMIDVLAERINKIYQITVLAFRMVAERVHRLQEGLRREHRYKVCQQAEQRFEPDSTAYDFVNSALLVKPSHLDPTTAAATSTCCLRQNKQHAAHKRELPAIFEGNKQDQTTLGPTTTFKNWAAEVQIYMSLEDYNLSTIMEIIKTQTVPIIDVNYIDYELHQQGLGQRDEDKIRDDELQRLMRPYNQRVDAILRRNAARQERRDNGDQGVENDEDLPYEPELPDTFEAFTPEQQEQIQKFTEAFHYYSRALQYTLTKVTKGDPYRFVVQRNHNKASGFETWRRLHNWRDEVYNYESTISEIAGTIKLATLLQNIKGEVRAHLLLNFNSANPDFEAAATKVEDYYRKVYIDNNFSTGVNYFKGKYGKGNDKGKKGQEGTVHDPTTSKDEERAATKATAMERAKVAEVTTTTTAATEEEEKAKDQKEHHHTATFHNNNPTRGKDLQKEKATTTLHATFAAKQDTHPTNAGGEEISTTSTKHNNHQCGQYRMTIRHNYYNNYLHNPHQQIL